MIRQTFSKLYNLSPKKIVELLNNYLNSSAADPAEIRKAKDLEQKLQKEFQYYQTNNLQSITVEDFSQYIHSRIRVIDAKSEGYSKAQLAQQRDLSIKFTWGHYHDFGDFQLKGKMSKRHIKLLANFLTLFPISLSDLKDKNIFDIGCWTGGTTLLLARYAKQVVAIEEVNKYAQMTSFLVNSFGISKQVTVKPISVYDCDQQEFHNRFDIVYFPGVIYHLSDPVLALRILFNSLKPGGILLVESAGLNVDEPYCRFMGSKPAQQDKKSGWAWFYPSPSALSRMMKEVGFKEVKVLWWDKRIYGFGKKIAQVDM